MNRRAMAVLTGVFALGCGGLVQAPDVEIPPPPPLTDTAPPPPVPPTLSTAQPATVLIAKEAVVGCEIVLMKLPSLAEFTIGDSVYCSLFERLDAKGERALLSGAIMTLRTGATTILPRAPNFQNPITSSYHFTLTGEPVLHVEFGEGEPTFEEGPSYPITHRQVLTLQGGQWKAFAKSVSGEGVRPDPKAEAAFLEAEKISEIELPLDMLGSKNAKFETDPTVIAPLNAAAGTDARQWEIDWGPPSIAYPITDMGEGGTYPSPPVLLQLNGVWTPLEDTDHLDLRLDRQGDWLAVGSVSGTGWKLIDLTTGKTVWKGGKVQFWPSELPPPR